MALHSKKVNKKEKIKHWTDVWFGAGKRTGYVETNTERKKKRKFYTVNNVETLIKENKGKKDRFIGLNSFKYGSRRTEDLSQIRVLGVDIDYYKIKDLEIEEVFYWIDTFIDNGVIPCPNLVQVSRGIQIFYSIEGGAAPAMGWAADEIHRYLCDALEGVGADDDAILRTQLMRVPYSINTNNNSVVKPEIWEERHYTLQDFVKYCPALRYKKKRKGKHKRKNEEEVNKPKGEVKSIFEVGKVENLTARYRTNLLRVNDLNKLVELREGDFTYNRNVFLYVYAYHFSLICSSYEELEQRVEELRIFSRVDGEIPARECKDVLKSAFKDAKKFLGYYVQNGYKMMYKMNDGIKKPHNNKTIMRKLKITEKEMQEMETIVTEPRRKELKEEKRTKKRRDKGVRPKEEYQGQFRNNKEKGLALREKGYKNTDIAEELGIPLNTVKNWFRKKNLKKC